jgi:hypothetical protein
LEDNTLVELLAAIGSIATPILVLALTAVGWRVRTRLERRVELENKLRDDRLAVYNAILEPILLLFTPEATWKLESKGKGRDKSESPARTMLSLEYRQKAFRMSLVGSDNVVRAYNNFMQFFYQREEKAEPASDAELREMLSLVGTFLLEIRRNLGNEHTKLDNWEMLEWFLLDARRLRGKQ